MCGTHPLYEGTTISVNSDSCCVTTSSSMPLQAVAFTCDIPDEKTEAINRHSTVPVIFNLYEELDNPAMKVLVQAVTGPVSVSASTAATTNFETLCALKPVSINNACFEESRLGKPCE